MTTIAPDQLEQLRELRARLLAEADCRYTGKYRFPDQASAERRLATVDQRRRCVPCRVYECPDCGGWHLTSRPA